MTTATVLQHVVNALAAARELPHADRTREVSLVITKLEEATLWMHAHQVMVAAGITRPPDTRRATAGGQEALASSIGGASLNLTGTIDANTRHPGITRNPFPRPMHRPPQVLDCLRCSVPLEHHCLIPESHQKGLQEPTHAHPFRHCTMGHLVPGHVGTWHCCGRPAYQPSDVTEPVSSSPPGADGTNS